MWGRRSDESGFDARSAEQGPRKPTMKGVPMTAILDGKVEAQTGFGVLSEVAVLRRVEDEGGSFGRVSFEGNQGRPR
jgi:hypothetical protein